MEVEVEVVEHARLQTIIGEGGVRVGVVPQAVVLGQHLLRWWLGKVRWRVRWRVRWSVRWSVRWIKGSTWLVKKGLVEKWKLRVKPVLSVARVMVMSVRCSSTGSSWASGVQVQEQVRVEVEVQEQVEVQVQVQVAHRRAP